MLTLFKRKPFDGQIIVREFTLKLEVLIIAQRRGYMLPIGFLFESSNSMLHRVCKDLKASGSIYLDAKYNDGYHEMWRSKVK